MRAIPVWVAPNSLLLVSGIWAILKRRRNIRILPWHGDLAHEGPPQSRRALLIVDQGAISTATPEYVRSLRLRFPNARILIVGNRCRSDQLCRLLLLGAQGFVAYDDLAKSLARAVDALWAGRPWVHPRVLERLAGRGMEGNSTGAKVGLEVLTPRERLVVELLQQRLCNKEISARLNISQATVKFHLENIFNKLGLRDRHLVAEQAALGRPPGRLAT
jgi:DNA-binding NarL/FixJ family response regulator